MNGERVIELIQELADLMVDETGMLRYTVAEQVAAIEGFKFAMLARITGMKTDGLIPGEGEDWKME